MSSHPGTPDPQSREGKSAATPDPGSRDFAVCSHDPQCPLNHAPAASAMFDREMRYLHANNRWRADFGLGDRDVRGLSHYDDIPEVPEQWKKAYRRALAGEIVREDEDRFIRPDASVKWIRWEVRPWYDSAGGIGGIVILSEDITDRKLAEEALAASENRFRTLFERSPVGICLIETRTGRFLQANPRYCELVGRTEQQLTTLDIYSITHPADMAKTRENASWLALGIGSGYQVEKRYVRPDGSIRWVYAEGVSVPDTGAESPWSIGIVQDITDRKQGEDDLRRSEQRYRSLAEATSQVVWTLAAGGDAVDPQIWCDFTGQDPEEMRGEAWLQSVHPDDREATRTAWALAVQDGSVYEREHRVRRRDGEYRFMSVRGVPVREKDGRLREWIGTCTDITDRKRAEEALHASEERYRSVVSAMAEGVLLRDADGRILACNRSFEQMLGVTSEQMVGTTAADWEHRTIREDGSPFPGKDHPAMVALRTGRPQSNICMGFRRGDGGVTWVSINAQPIFRSGESKPHAVVTTFADITERKQAEQALRNSEAELREAQRLGRIGSWYRDLKTNTLTWSEQVDCVLGSDPKAQLLTLAQTERFFAPESWKRLVQANERLLSTGGTDELEVEFRRQDGTAGWATMHREAVRDEAGEIVGLRGVGLDITERKRIETALSESEARLRTALEAAEMGTFERDLQTGQANWMPTTEAMFGFAPGKAPASMEDFLRLIHPEDREHFERIMTESTAAGVAGGEWRVIWPDGSVHWISGRWRVFQDDRGRPLRAIGVDYDITERKQAEEALRASEERLRLAQEVAQIGTFDRDLLTGEARWTSQMKAAYGLRPEDQPPTLDQVVALVHPDDRRLFSGLLARSMESGEGSGEWRVLLPNGNVRWISGRWRIFKDATGKPLRMIGIDYDITAHKRTEEELRQAKERLTEEKLYLEQTIDTEMGFEEIVGKSAGLKAVMELAARVAASDATVLLLGETGVGKELVARAIHRLSLRKGNSFIKMNCAAIPSGLLESELFGAEKGAYTGAVSRKIGRMELADKGTIFLDEIGEISLALQPKLLRVLQDHEFERLGGTQTLKVDFRLIAATNRDLAEEVEQNQFRRDLFYRLNVFPIYIPPLRERRDDLPLLVEHFVQKCARRMNKSITSIPTRTMNALAAWDWPGNVRELENFIERSVILSNGSVLAAPLSELQAKLAPDDEQQTLEAAERRHILEALRQSQGRISGERGAAARLGLKRTTLQSKLKQLRINPRTPPPN